jgi:hypothetical protein
MRKRRKTYGQCSTIWTEDEERKSTEKGIIILIEEEVAF